MSIFEHFISAFGQYMCMDISHINLMKEKIRRPQA